MASSNPFLELAGSPGGGTSAFTSGNFGSRPSQRPAGVPRLPAPPRGSLPKGASSSVRLSALIARSRPGSMTNAFLP